MGNLSLAHAEAGSVWGTLLWGWARASTLLVSQRPSRGRHIVSLFSVRLEITGAVS